METAPGDMIITVVLHMQARHPKLQNTKRVKLKSRRIEVLNETQGELTRLYQIR